MLYLRDSYNVIVKLVKLMKLLKLVKLVISKLK